MNFGKTSGYLVTGFSLHCVHWDGSGPAQKEDSISLHGALSFSFYLQCNRKTYMNIWKKW